MLIGFGKKKSTLTICMKSMNHQFIRWLFLSLNALTWCDGDVSINKNVRELASQYKANIRFSFHYPYQAGSHEFSFHRTGLIRLRDSTRNRGEQLFASFEASNGHQGNDKCHESYVPTHDENGEFCIFFGIRICLASFQMTYWKFSMNALVLLIIQQRSLFSPLCLVT